MRPFVRWASCLIFAVPLLSVALQAFAMDPSVPALRVSAPNGRTSILIGGLHSAVGGLREPGPEIFSGAQRYVVESVTSDGSTPAQVHPSLQSALTYKATGQWPRAPWAQTLPDSVVAGLRERLICNGLVPRGHSPEEITGMILSMPRAVTAQAIGIRRCGPPGLRSRDELLQTMAQERHLPVVGLELQADVQQRRLSIDDAVYVRTMLAGMSLQGLQGLRDTVNALNEGDYDRVRSILGALSSKADAQTIDRVMVRDRNEAWMKRLTAYLLDGGAVVNVGADHLGGASGLIALLKHRGFRITKFDLPSAGRE